MSAFLLIISIIIFACIFMNRVSNKIGIPALLAFIGLGILFSMSESFRPQFRDFAVAEKICSVALIFIMFYGGFGTNWKEGKKAAPKAVVLSTIGVLFTATLTAIFCHFVLKFGIIESFLLGSVLASTDAASVFSILRSKKLNLKYNTASLLEIESGSNDPVAYMLTAIFLTIYQGKANGFSISYMIFAQIAYGLGFGFLIAFLAIYVINKMKNTDSGFFMIFIVGIAIVSYALPVSVGGNGYLSVYIVGLMIGNRRFKDKISLVHFFDGITTFMQMLIFFLLGLLSNISSFPKALIPAIIIALFITFVARPITTFTLLAPFKAKLNQIALVSWSGLRGASSIVFAITVMISVTTKNDIFHISFIIVLFSIFIQGSLLPMVAKKSNMIDENEDIMKTFNDYIEEVPIQFIQIDVPPNHKWIGKMIKEIELPPETIIVLIRRDEKSLTPKGDTIISENDKMILSAKSFAHVEDGIELMEIDVKENDEYDGKKISETSLIDDGLIIMIKRDDNVIIPRGDVILQNGDILVVSYTE